MHPACSGARFSVCSHPERTQQAREPDLIVLWPSQAGKQSREEDWFSCWWKLQRVRRTVRSVKSCDAGCCNLQYMPSTRRIHCMCPCQADALVCPCFSVLSPFTCFFGLLACSVLNLPGPCNEEYRRVVQGTTYFTSFLRVGRLMQTDVFLEVTTVYPIARTQLHFLPTCSATWPVHLPDLLSMPDLLSYLTCSVCLTCLAAWPDQPVWHAQLPDLLSMSDLLSYLTCSACLTC